LPGEVLGISFTVDAWKVNTRTDGMPTMKSLPLMHPLVCSLILLWLGIIIPPIGHTDIYSWVDADGVKHFTNKPPPGAVTITRHSREIPYDAPADLKSQVADEHYFDQRALESALRRLAQTERALAESLARAQAAERRADNLMPAYEAYEYDYPYTWGTSYVGDVYDDDYDRRARKTRDRRRGHHRGRARNRHGGRPEARPQPSENGRHIATPLPERRTRANRNRRHRLSKRERGVTLGLTRVVRAVPSPYYMGYRPVYTRDASYRSGRGAQGRRTSRHGARGSRGSGARARVSF
jgi:hypothetical protein